MDHAEFICEPRGTVNVNGKGKMEVWLVIDVKNKIGEPGV